MAKYCIGIVLIIGIGLGVFLKNSEKTEEIEQKASKSPQGDRYIQFVELPSDILAQSGDLKVLKTEVRDNILASYENEKTELSMASAFKQFVIEKNREDKVTFFMDKPKRSIESIFLQYEVRVSKPANLVFENYRGDGVFVQVGEDKYDHEDINRKGFLWGALETKIFQRKVAIIEDKIRKKVLASKAKNLNISVHRFIKEKVLGGGRSIASVDKGDRIDRYVKDKLLDLPVKANLAVPKFELELKPDWTPNQGDPSAEVKVILFTDFYSPPSRDLLKAIPSLASKYNKVYFGFRPLFPVKDRYQRRLAEFGFCTWVSDQEKFWNFISDAAAISKKTFQESLYKLAEEKEIDLAAVKDCFFKKTHKAVVDYHLDYGKFLGISIGPIVYIDGEVMMGGVTEKMIDKILQRKTWLRNPGNI